jgi:alpha-tubulin suppressor-like RCC1 family protein
MRSPESRLTLFPAALTAAMFLLTAPPAAQGPSMSIAPSNPTIVVGQAVQFTATGAVAPTSVSAGGEYTCLGLADGSARCAGRNQFGQLGDGSWTNSAFLVQPSGLTSVRYVAAGDEFTCALGTNGTAACWGLGEKGQRGDGSFAQVALSPVPVQGLTTATALTGGYNHACALLSDGTMRCWGSNAQGQLGDPSTIESAVPNPVPGVSGVLAIATGAFHTCALLLDRTARCWGDNSSGQLGNGTFTSSSTPVTVAGLSNAVAIAGGGSQTCAVLADGSVRCWGNNYEGQLGDGTGTPSAMPVQVAGIGSAVEIAGGWAHTCARLADSTIRCWGQGVNGELGNGATENALTPVTVSGISTAVGLTGGWWHHSCGLLADGSVRCWGTNAWGQFGNGTTTDSAVPVAMSGVGVTWTSSNPGIATITSAGRATAIGPGVTTITATDAGGAVATTTLTVTRPSYTLTVVKSGLLSALGQVSSSPDGISCDADCSSDYLEGTVVTLTASPGALVTSWTGCDTVSGATCVVTMQSARTVTAAFAGLPNQP